MKKPKEYKQTDPRWAKLPYQVPGETATIGGSGCGPTCASMLIETVLGKKVSFTPVDACKWSVDHGYKAKGQGTYYSYFAKQLNVFGIECYQVNWANIYGNTNSEVHKYVKELLDKGHYIIACMGKGLWTSSGHFVILYKIDGDTAYISDPASRKSIREVADYNLFKSQVKYYFAVYAPNCKEEEEEMNTKLTQEEFNTMFTVAMDNYLTVRSTLPPSNWAIPHIDYLMSLGIITDPTRPLSFTSREEVLTIVSKAVGAYKEPKEVYSK